MVNYKNGRIYKLISNVSNKIYIGSTCLSLCRRLASHRNLYKRYLKGKRGYVSSFEIIKENNYNILLIKKVKCDSKEELNREERKYIEIYKLKEWYDCVNKNIPMRNKSEYYKDNKGYFKDYYFDNKSKICELSKKYYIDNKSKKCEYNKKYNQTNKDIIRIYNQIYYYKNKNKKNKESINNMNLQLLQMLKYIP